MGNCQQGVKHNIVTQRHHTRPSVTKNLLMGEEPALSNSSKSFMLTEDTTAACRHKSLLSARMQVNEVDIEFTIV